MKSTSFVDGINHSGRALQRSSLWGTPYAPILVRRAHSTLIPLTSLLQPFRKRFWFRFSVCRQGIADLPQSLFLQSYSGLPNNAANWPNAATKGSNCILRQIFALRPALRPSGSPPQMSQVVTEGSVSIDAVRFTHRILRTAIPARARSASSAPWRADRRHNRRPCF